MVSGKLLAEGTAGTACYALLYRSAIADVNLRAQVRSSRLVGLSENGSEKAVARNFHKDGDMKHSINIPTQIGESEMRMANIVSVIKRKNPEDVTRKELSALELVIEETIQAVNNLQSLHRSLTGKEYVPPIRLR